MTEQKKSKRTVIYCEPELLVRNAISQLLAREFGFEILALTENASETLEAFDTIKPDILITEIGLADTSGIELIRELARRRKTAACLVLTSLTNSRHTEQAFLAGAKGVFFKNSGLGQFKSCLAKILAGEIYRPPLEIEVSTYTADPLEKLTPREKEIFYLLANGVKIAEVAENLYISKKTAEVHRTKVVSKLGLDSPSEITRFAVKNGLAVI